MSAIQPLSLRVLCFVWLWALGSLPLNAKQDPAKDGVAMDRARMADRVLGRVSDPQSAMDGGSLALYAPSLSNSALQPILTTRAKVTAAVAKNTAADRDIKRLRTVITRIRSKLNMRAVGVAIVDEDGPVWLEAFADGEGTPVDASTTFPIGSAAHYFLGLAAMKLVEAGRLDLDAPLRRLAPEIQFQNPWSDTHILRFVHLLEQTTGWDGTHYAEYRPRASAAEPLADALNRYTGSRISRWPPGTRMSNQSSSPAVAAYVLEKIIGEPLEAFLKREIFRPLGMDNTFYFSGSSSDLEVDARFTAPYVSYAVTQGAHASLSDIAALLGFAIRRGKTDPLPILAEQSLARMEMSLTTLGSARGAMVAHGLGVSITGHEKYQVPFFGHRTRLFEFAYSPILKKGFVVMATSDVKGVRTIAREIKSYLLAPYRLGDVAPNPLPENFRDMNGYYVRVSGFSERDRLLTDLVGILRVRTSETEFKRSPLLGNFESLDYFDGGEALINTWTGLPTIAQVDDPIVGKAMQAWVTYKQVPGILVYGRLVFAAFLTMLCALAILYTPWLLVECGVRGSLPWPHRLLRLSVCFGSVIAALMFSLFFFIGTPLTLGVVGPLSVSIFLLSITYAVFASASILAVLWVRRGGQDPLIHGCFVTLGCMHCLFAVYLAHYGWIGMSSWNV